MTQEHTDKLTSFLKEQESNTTVLFYDTNYENIKSYLFSKGLIMSRQDKRNVRYYATI